MKITDSPETIASYIKGYHEGFHDFQKRAIFDLWEVHHRVQKLDQDLADLLEESITRISKIR